MKLKLPLATLIYGAMFHFAYAAFINPVFEYAHYYYFEPSLGRLGLTYLVLVAPVFAYRTSMAPAAYGTALIFVLCYVPAQLILLFTLERPHGEVALAQASLAASMVVLFWASPLGGGNAMPVRSEQRLSPAIGVLTVASIALLVASYHQHMRLVSFEDVYDLRLEGSEDRRSALADYLISWLSYCFLPFYFARGILRKRSTDIVLGLVGCLLIYSATGSKAAILMPLIIYSLHRLIGPPGKDFLFRLILVLTAVLFLIIQLLPNEGPLLWVKSILMMRILGTSGWNIATYFDYFSNNGFTFYTHIGPVNALTHAYPYGEYALGQVIGLHYSGSEEANFNANFWASDGFAALGILGIPIVTAAVAAVFYAINRIGSGYSTRFVVLWLSGFWLTILNVPLTTAFLSGGGAITLLLLWSTRSGTSRRRGPARGGPDRIAPRDQSTPSTDRPASVNYL